MTYEVETCWIRNGGFGTTSCSQGNCNLRPDNYECQNPDCLHRRAKLKTADEVAEFCRRAGRPVMVVVKH